MDTWLDGSKWNYIQNVCSTAVTLSSLTEEHINSSVVRQPFPKLVASSRGTTTKITITQVIWNNILSAIKWYGREVLSMPHLFSVPFWKCKVLLWSPCIAWYECLISTPGMCNDHIYETGQLHHKNYKYICSIITKCTRVDYFTRTRIYS